GLQFFIRFYERKTPMTRTLEGVELESCGRLAGVSRGLRSLEVRMRPDEQRDAQISRIVAYHRAIRELGGRPADPHDAAPDS
ncbi:hypothetical protein Q8G71_36500, partial [Klebsiella pneumoniae]